MINHIAREPWMKGRACQLDKLGLFFPRPGQSAQPAKNICADCPVVQQCAQYAIDDHGLVGVFGGLTEGERDRIRGARRGS